MIETEPRPPHATSTLVATQVCWCPTPNSTGGRLLDQSCLAICHMETQPLRVALGGCAAEGDDYGVLASGFGCGLHSPLEHRDLYASSAIVIECTGTVEADDFVFGDD